MKTKNKKICEICENGEAVIKQLNIDDISRLQQAIQSFSNQEDCFCDDVDIKIYADGRIKLSAEFKFYDEEYVVI